MQFVRRLTVFAILAVGLGLGPIAVPAIAGSTDPLFINLTTDDVHRLDMALAFGGNQLQRGHPLTVFTNDRAVLAASKTNTASFAGPQKALGALLDKGAPVLVCPMCMKHYGVAESDLLAGLVVCDPERTGAALFKENGKSLSW